MILIISDEFDVTTNKIIEYLLHFGNNDFIRINANAKISLRFDYASSKYILIYRGRSIDLKKISAVLYRRGNLSYDLFSTIDASHVPKKAIRNFLAREWHCLKDFVFLFLYNNKKIKCFGNFFGEVNNNRLFNYKIAKDCGLLIPRTFILESQADICATLSQDSFITKAATYSYSFRSKDEVYYSDAVRRVDRSEAVQLPEEFFPSLVQEYIDKKYEVRAFYCEGQFYPMAIFSQLDEKTKFDFRNYNLDKPTRCVPYSLPKLMKRKLREVIKRLNLNTCSIDLIYSTTNKYYFLEINPHGQFDWLSLNCNYYLEKKISKILGK